MTVCRTNVEVEAKAFISRLYDKPKDLLSPWRKWKRSPNHILHISRWKLQLEMTIFVAELAQAGIIAYTEGTPHD